MEKRENRSYTEISLETDGFDRTYRNPLAKTYCYEYALYRAVSDLFASTECSSRCIDSLKLYFAELPDGCDRDADTRTGGGKTRTKKDYLAEVAGLAARDVAGHVRFPMMNICAAKVQTFTESDGTHTFLFTDGLYGFLVHIKVPSKGHPEGIAVKDMHPLKKKDGETDEKAALKSAA